MEPQSQTLRYSVTQYRPSTRSKPTFCMESASIALSMGSAISVVMFGANEMLATAAHAGAVEQLSEIQWAIFPLGGALTAATMSFLFKRGDWMETMGRFIGAMVVGVFSPRLITYMHPAIKEWSLDPILIFGAGFGFGLAGYALAKFAVSWAASRGVKLAEMEADAFAHRREKNLRVMDRDQPTEKLNP